MLVLGKNTLLEFTSASFVLILHFLYFLMFSSQCIQRTVSKDFLSVQKRIFSSLSLVSEMDTLNNLL